MSLYQMEYTNTHPCISVRFTVDAENFNDAVRKGDSVVSQMKRRATYTIGPIETERRRNGDGEPL